MRFSIRTKLLILCIFLVSLTAGGISGTYYVLAKQDKQRESRQRIQIAFDIILGDFINRSNTYTKRLHVFLIEETSLSVTSSSYIKKEERIRSTSFLTNYLCPVAHTLKKLGHDMGMDRLALYTADPQKRLLVIYQQYEDQETSGAYVVSETGNDTYFPVKDTSQQMTMLIGTPKIPDMSLPSGVVAYYEGDIPERVSAQPFSEGRRFGIRVTAPVYQQEEITGVLIGDIFYTQEVVGQYAALSKTAVNLFAGNQLTLGTLPAQTTLSSERMNSGIACHDLTAENISAVDIISLTFDDQEYYQGYCVLKNVQDTVGAITVSLSKDIEKQEIKKILIAISIISGLAIGISFLLSLMFSRNTIRAIQNIASVIGAASEGNLRMTARTIVAAHDEIGIVALKLTQMIHQLRNISGQVQNASHTVNHTADTILQQMESLIQHMEQQSVSVDNTTTSIENIMEFIEVVARNINELLMAAAHILSSLQETRASIQEVTTSTGSLTTQLHRISSSIEQVSSSIRDISEKTGTLADVAQNTEKEIHYIDQSLQEVSHNADRTQHLAKETMNAATSGQTSVEVSLQGMTELKTVVADTAQIIREVNSLGERVSSILDIVDDITEQTSLLSLNASIISAQAGAQGRGFAVVADEIKELATRTKTSTKEIGSLIHELRMKTEEGVNNTEEGLKKADQGMQLAHAVKDALNTILESATRSSNRAADTARLIQRTTTSSQAINTQINVVTEMVSHIRGAVQKEEQDLEQIVNAVEHISAMSEQVNRAGLEQNRTAEDVAQKMENMTGQFSDISDQTEALRQDVDQIVTAMHTIESTTDQILEDTTGISGETVRNLVQQSEVLQKSVSVFKL